MIVHLVLAQVVSGVATVVAVRRVTVLLALSEGWLFRPLFYHFMRLLKAFEICGLGKCVQGTVALSYGHIHSGCVLPNWLLLISAVTESDWLIK